MVILLHFCASLATRSKYFLSCPKLLLGLPNLAYHMGGNMQISVTVTSGRYSMKKAELGFTWSMRFQTVCLGVLGSWLRSHHSGGGEPPGQGSDPSLPSFRQNKFPSRTLYLSYILGTPRGCF